ncbi:Bug family tripartite tricarboxylate transporter substrate binding protein [Hydrogenophaga sp. BPS33]|uniref:Bug family tripartite tricarboxylate transporter substrate binding protein n=1 Tax=Hydrogenophaga sp. BPS33 TaxID=2651974 RepID=UPI001320070F|nr:tripartite tricarboxylate transporter substrate binding protein [Hydrogenophaga sp. BPS33]QHE84191.1 tripartite tricarboxylate transporter substrate binding protein [Hydrogenophaga sp. BPS33]
MSINRRQLMTGVASGLAVSALPSLAHAADWPTKPVRIIVPYAAGGSADAVSRIFGQRLSQRIGQPVVVENRPGAGTIVGTDYASKQPPDGHTLVFSASGLPILPSSNKNFKLDLNKDLTPISEVVRGGFVVVSNPSMPFRTLPEMIAYAKRNPGKLSYGAAGLGTSVQLTGEYLKALTGTFMLCIPYAGSAPALAAVLSNEVNLFIDPVNTIKPHVESGRLVGLVQTSKQRSPSLPQVPTSAEVGMPNFDVTYWMGFHAPGGMAPDLARTISGHFAAIAQEPETRDRLIGMGFEIAGTTPEAFGKLVNDDQKRWAKLIQDAKLSFN